MKIAKALTRLFLWVSPTPHMRRVTFKIPKVNKKYTRKEQIKEEDLLHKKQTSVIPNPQEEEEEEENAMHSVFLQSSLPITVSESDTELHVV